MTKMLRLKTIDTCFVFISKYMYRSHKFHENFPSVWQKTKTQAVWTFLILPSSFLFQVFSFPSLPPFYVSLLPSFSSFLPLSPSYFSFRRRQHPRLRPRSQAYPHYQAGDKGEINCEHYMKIVLYIRSNPGCKDYMQCKIRFLTRYTPIHKTNMASPCWSVQRISIESKLRTLHVMLSPC